MKRRPTRPTRTYTLVPYKALYRSGAARVSKAESVRGFAADPVKRGAVGARPRARRCRVIPQDARGGGMEGGAVIHMQPMRDLVRHGRAADMIRGEDQPPAITDRARRRAASPSPARIAHRHLRSDDPGPARLKGGFLPQHPEPPPPPPTR